MPMGTPPNGSDTSADEAVRRAPSGSRWQKAFKDEREIAARDMSSASRGEIDPARNAETREQASPVQTSPPEDEDGDESEETMARRLYRPGATPAPAITRRPPGEHQAT